MKTPPLFLWALRMALRDGRKSWRRLFVYLSATAIGIAALVAAGSFRDNLQEMIRQQAKPLLGADLVVQSRRPFDSGAFSFFDSFPYPRVQETRFATMVFFPSADAGRLIELRAVQKGFPFYGDVNTEPPGAIVHLFEKPLILLEESTMAEFGLRVGDAVHLGKAEFRVVGRLQLIPGEAVASLFSAPRAFIAGSFLDLTGLLKQESLSWHRMYFKIPDERDGNRALPLFKRKADQMGWRVDTVQDRQRSLGRQARNAERFLNLAALVMLILGGIGVASIMQIYAREKWVMAASLKCLGAPARPTVGIFVIQAAALGLLGSLVGGALGVLIQAVLPFFLARFVTVPIPFFLSWNAIFNGTVVGLALSFLFTLIPLIPLRKVPPLAAFRFGYGAERPFTKDPWAWACGLLIAVILFLFSLRQMPSRWGAALVPIGLAGGLLMLELLTRISLRWLQKQTRDSLPFAFRQGLAGLFRPNNQTFLLVPILGLGSALLFVISFSHNSLLRHVSFSPSVDEPNMAIFDIQDDQKEALKQQLTSAGKPVLEEVAIVAMRLERIKDRSVQELRKDPNTKIPRWALNRDYRSTYRNHLTPGEEIVAGRWPAVPSGDGRVPISLEEELAESLDVTVGDEIVFNVQGVLLETVVAGLRKVDWYKLRPNFFAVFPEGVLEEAPKFHVVLTRGRTPEESAEIQRLLRKNFPNTSTLDLRLILTTLDTYLSKITFVLRFMGLFVVATGLLVLSGALLSTRFERIREAALLRTLGASRRAIRTIHVIEYGLTGFFSGLAGLGLGLLASALLTHYLFEISFKPAFSTAPIGLGLVVLVTTWTGLFLGRGMLKRPPLETLRED